MKDFSSELNQEAAKLMNIQGNVRGEVLIGNLRYLKIKEGEKGMVLLGDRLKELGFPLRLHSFKSLKWYPEFFSVLIMLAIKEIFKWQDKDIFDMGNAVPKSSFVVQVLIKHFSSRKLIFNEYPNYWRAHFDFGSLEIIDFNDEKRYFVFRIRGYKFHSVACLYYAGYFLRIAQFGIIGGKAEVEEIRCAQKDNIDYHEYKIKWQ